MMGWAFGFAKARYEQRQYWSLVDQMLSAICESSRIEAVSSLWDQLTKRVNYLNNKIANSMLSMQPIFFADMAED